MLNNYRLQLPQAIHMTYQKECPGLRHLTTFKPTYVRGCKGCQGYLCGEYAKVRCLCQDLLCWLVW